MEIGKRSKKQANKIIISYLLFVVIMFSCTTKQKENYQVVGLVKTPPTIVYKMKKDYHLNVPVILTKDKKEILSYPEPTDIYYQGKLAYPTKLTGNYFLDNRGINKNVAFLSYTYENYSKLKKAPSKDTLWARILDKDPILEMYDCGNRYQYKNEIKDLNNLVKKHFETCKKIK